MKNSKAEHAGASSGRNRLQEAGVLPDGCPQAGRNPDGVNVPGERHGQDRGNGNIGITFEVRR